MSNTRQMVNGTTADCAAFQDQLPSLFESEEDVATHEHLQTCENCRTLVQELQYIVDAAKLLLPIHDPSPSVWDNIQTAWKKESTSTK